MVRKFIASTFHCNDICAAGNRFGQDPKGSSNKPPNNPSTTKKLAAPKQQSIADQDLIDDDDEIFILASQKQEEELRQMNQQRAQKAIESNMTFDLNYSSFNVPVATTSTQNVCRPATTAHTEDIRNNLFIDLTTESQQMPPPKALNRPVLEDTQRNADLTQSSQKENISASQALTRQSNQIKALQIQIKNFKEKNAGLQEKLMVKNGETENLRRDKKSLEDQIKEFRLQKLKESAACRDSPEVQRLTKELQRLKEETAFNAFNQSSLRAGPVETVNVQTNIPFFTNIPTSSMQSIETSIKMFEEDEHRLSNITSKINTEVDIVQKRLAQVHLLLLSGGVVDDATLNSIFMEATKMIRQIENNVLHLESWKEKQMTYDNNPALSAFCQISNACFREKLTTFDSVTFLLNKHQGFKSIYQPENLFPEEICAKPRRILAFYASIARISRSFSERLLLEAVCGEDELSRSFVSVVRDVLANSVRESDQRLDYFGFTLASSSLLANLAIHYDAFESNEAIDSALFWLFRAVLQCSCDSPLIMKNLSEFLFHVTKNPRKSQIASKLCVNFDKEAIDFSKIYKYSCYPPDACAFQLFLTFLLTAFTSTSFNRLELQLLLETSLNLNRIASNLQDMKPGTLQFLNQSEGQSVCSCFSTLVYAILALNYTSLRHRNVSLSQVGSNDRPKAPKFNKRKSALYILNLKD